jgi:hypothetical protein
MTHSEISAMIEGGRHLVPLHMWGGIERYMTRGIPGGSFMNALLSNDLMEAFACADGENTDNMRNWCAFLYNYAPRGSYGSPENVAEWCKERVA